MPARRRFCQRSVAQAVHVGASERALIATLIAYCTHGVVMTESVDQWIHRAGERCIDAGLSELGHALERHAVLEEDRHLMMIDEARRLIALWNERHEDQIDLDELRAQPLGQGLDPLLELLEAVIASDHPYAQLAVGLEIESVSITANPVLLETVRAVCGSEVADALSFRRDHVALDSEHVEFNRRQLRELLAAKPEALEPLVSAGRLALAAYGQFLDDCWSWASARAER